jgi:hypothetical protein
VRVSAGVVASARTRFNTRGEPSPVTIAAQDQGPMRDGGTAGAEKAKSPGFTERFCVVRDPRDTELTPTGFELPSDCTGKALVSHHGGAQSGALGDKTAPDRAKVVKAWPVIPPTVKARILALIQASAEE